MKVSSHQMRPRKVTVEFEIISAGRLMRNIPEGLWQQLKRKSVLTRKPFPPGSNAVMVMYRDDSGEQRSGAVHLEELPDAIRSVVESGKTWEECNR
jgi:hypothetical protein